MKKSWNILGNIVKIHILNRLKRLSSVIGSSHSFKCNILHIKFTLHCFT